MNSNENDFETVAVFNNSFEPQLVIAKSMLEQAGIRYYVTNENFMGIDPLTVAPTAMSLELRVDKSKVDEALRIIESIDEK
jgi:hypothetical protein